MSSIVHHVGEAVGAEQQAVAGVSSTGYTSTSTVGVDAERARDDRTLRVHGGLVRGEPAVAHELLDEAVVVGQLAQLAVAQQVRARVADVADEHRAAAHERAGGERGAHAAQASSVQRLRRTRPRLASSIASRSGSPAVTPRAQRLERGRARDLPAAVAAHAVGERDTAPCASSTR